MATTGSRLNSTDGPLTQEDLAKLDAYPGGIGSHCTPETPGSIHEGGELGYSISHAFWAAFDNPDLLVAVAVGDGEAETGPLATSWHSAKYLNPARDGAVLPILHLITSTVWRQDHSGFTHQDPGFIDVVVNKNPEVTRIYLPPDVNCLLSTADHCLRGHDDINVIVCDKQNHLQYLDTDAAVRHCTKGVGIWDWASNDQGSEPDVVMAGCGDVPTKEALAATALLREHFPDLKIRFINVVDLYRMTPETEHPHGLSSRDFDSLFTRDKPIIFNFHGYPWLIHRLAYRRTNHANLHVRGYKEKGNINTPLELAINNEIDRFSLAIDVINRVPRLQVAGAHVGL